LTKTSANTVCFSGLVRGVAKAPDITDEDIDIMLSTNVTGLIHMTQAIMPIFKKRPGGGAGDIINVGSIAGLRNIYLPPLHMGLKVSQAGILIPGAPFTARARRL
jgi:NADP-dependent 3-hydroxy acid dehydrogenase YdfG